MSSSLLNKCKSSQNRSSSCDFGFLILNTPIPGRKIIYVIRPYLPYTVQRKVGKFYLDGAKNWLHHFWSVNTCSRQFAVETCWARLIRPPPYTAEIPGWDPDSGTLRSGDTTQDLLLDVALFPYVSRHYKLWWPYQWNNWLYQTQLIYPLADEELCRSSAHGVVPALVSNSSRFVKWRRVGRRDMQLWSERALLDLFKDCRCCT